MHSDLNVAFELSSRRMNFTTQSILSNSDIDMHQVFTVCDKLYAAEEINEMQLLYLRHLVLIRDEAMASIYDQYQVPII